MLAIALENQNNNLVVIQMLSFVEQGKDLDSEEGRLLIQKIASKAVCGDTNLHAIRQEIIKLYMKKLDKICKRHQADKQSESVLH